MDQPKKRRLVSSSGKNRTPVNPSSDAKRKLQPSNEGNSDRKPKLAYFPEGFSLSGGSSSSEEPKGRWVKLEREPTHTLAQRLSCKEAERLRVGATVPLYHPNAVEGKAGKFRCPDCGISFELIGYTLEF